MKKASVDRLDLAEQALTYMEEMLDVGGLSVENLPLALNEVQNLQAYRAQDPDRVDNLVLRYSLVAYQLRRIAN